MTTPYQSGIVVHRGLWMHAMFQKMLVKASTTKLLEHNILKWGGAVLGIIVVKMCAAAVFALIYRYFLHSGAVTVV